MWVGIVPQTNVEFVFDVGGHRPKTNVWFYVFEVGGDHVSIWSLIVVVEQ